MKTKQLFFALTLFYSISLFSQVGVGNTNPQASLDISASSTTTPANNDGVLIPRMSNFPASPAAAQDGMLIFYTGSGASGKGFYYWNNTTSTWVFLASGAKNTLDEAYDEGGAGNGRVINTTDGAVELRSGNDFLYIDGTSNTTDNKVGIEATYEATGAAIVTGINQTFDSSSNTSPGRTTGIIQYFTNLQRATSGLSNSFSNYSLPSGQNIYGVQNYFNSGSFPFAYGFLNTLAPAWTINGNFVGYRNSIESGGTGYRTGFEAYMGGTGTGTKKGLDVNIITTAGGTHYGVYSSVLKTGSYSGYFLGDVYIGTTGSNGYNLPSTDGTTNYVMATDGSGQVNFVDPSSLLSISHNTLDQAYDEGGAGNGRTITADNGAVSINGEDGFVVSGSFGNGNTIDSEVTGAGTRMFFNPNQAAFRAGTVSGGQWESTSVGDYSTAFGYDTTAEGDYSMAFGNNTAAGASHSTAFGYSTIAEGDYSLAFGETTHAEGDHSIAFGSNTHAEGSLSSAFGALTYAYGTYSIASGNQSQAIGDYSLTVGQLAIAAGAYSAAFGANSTAGGEYSFVFGNNSSSHADADYSLVFGNSSYAQGYASFAFGESANAYANFSTAFGTNTIANNDYSIAMGRNTYAAGVNSTALGHSTIATSAYETVIGQYNNSLVSGNITTWQSADPLFVIGNGTSSSAESNALTIYKNGLMNINDAYDMPLTDGTANQVIATDGSGSLSFVDATTLVPDDHDWYEQGTSTAPDDINDNIFTQGNVAIGKNTANYTLDIQNTSSTMLRGLNIDKSDTYNVNTDDGTTAIFAHKTGGGTGRSHAIFTDVDGSGTGQKYGVFNRISSSANGNQYGTRNYLSGATSSYQFGTFNNLANNGTGNQYGVYNGMRGVSANNLYGLYNEFDEAFSGVNEITGVKNQFSNGTPGTSEGMNGIFSRFSTSANGNYYGVRNEFTSTATGTGNKYGSYNIIDSSAGGNQYGVYSEVTNTSGYSGYYIGRFSVSTPSDSKFVVASNGDTILGGDLYWRDEDTNGTILAQMLDDGDDARFILRENGSISVDLDMNTQFVFNEQGFDRDFRVESNSIANMFRVDAGNNRVGIATGAPDAILDIEGNSNGTVTQLEVTETASGDGSRIKFNNSVETDEHWILYGRSDNTIGDNKFNLYHSNALNVFTADGNGFFGINETSPDTRLHLRHNNGGATGGFKIENATGGNYWRLYTTSAPTGDLRLYSSISGGTTPIGAFDGASGAYTAFSDRRLKKDFKDLHFNWKRFMKLSPLTYQLKNQNNGTRYIGMVAQDVQKIYPELITYHKEEDVYHMDYSATGVIAIKAVQELKEEVETLKQENTILKEKLKKLETLEARILAIENK